MVPPLVTKLDARGDRKKQSQDAENLDVDDLDGSKAKENEIVELHHRYRRMEEERKNFAEKAKKILKIQRDMISKLETEKTDLEMQLGVAYSSQNARKDMKNSQQLAALLEKQEACKSAIKAEKRKVDELDCQLRQLEKQLSEKRHSSFSERPDKQKALLQKRINLLENRLDHVHSMYNQKLSRNAALRREIGHMVSEKNQFMALYRRMEKQLEDGKKELQDTIEQAAQAYDQREEAFNRLKLLRQAEDTEIGSATMEVQQLRRYLDHDQRLQDFLETKVVSRPIDPRAEEDRERRNKKKSAYSERIDMTADEASEYYQKLLNEIVQITDEENIDHILEGFKRKEADNFGLYAYINEMNSEVAAMQEDVASLKSQIEEEKKKGKEAEEERTKEELELQEKLQVAQKDTNDAQEKLTATQSLFNELKESIRSIFQEIKCNDSPIVELLGNKNEINENNLMLYLGLIEQRTNELLHMRQFFDSKQLRRESRRAVTAAAQPHKTSYINKQPDLLPPELKEDDDVIETDLPMDHTQLREKLVLEEFTSTTKAQTTTASPSPTGSRTPHSSRKSTPRKKH